MDNRRGCGTTDAVQSIHKIETVRYKSALEWPLGYQRTPYGQRAFGRFKTSRRDVTLVESCARVLTEIGMLTPYRQPWRTSRVFFTANIPIAEGGARFYSSPPRPGDPGVSVLFDLDNEDRVFACDRYTEVAQNFAALAAFLEALRAMQRYGVAESDRIFTGFAALPAPGQSLAIPLGGSSWWEILGVSAEIESLEELDSAYKAKVQKCHPAVNGGSETALQELNVARAAAIQIIEYRLKQK